MFIRFARSAIHSPAVHTAAALAAGGVGFALGNLLLARLLPSVEFGKVSLLLAWVQIGGALGVPGLPILVNRYRLDATDSLLRLCAAGSAAAGLIVSGALVVFYGSSAVFALTVAGAVALAAMSRVAASFFQSRQRFGASLLLLQVHNWLVLASVPVVVLTGQPYAMAVASVVLCGYLATALLGWRSALKWPREKAPQLTRRQWWHEGLSAAGIMLAMNLLLQLDRLLIGATLTLSDLATYSVVAAVAGSPFRMLQIGAGYALTPRLRTCPDRAAVLKLLVNESALMLAAGALATALIVSILPWLMVRFLGGRYVVGDGLVIALIVIGFVRMWDALAAAIVSALGSTRELVMLNIMGWLTVAVSTACALLASGYGLLGMTMGLGAGWCVSAAGVSMLAVRILARMKESPVAHLP